MTEPDQTPSMGDKLRAYAGWVAFISRSMALTVEVFLHRRFGERFIGVQATAAVLIVLIYSVFWEGHDLRPMFGFLTAYLVMCLIARLGITYRRWRGEQLHSYYTGEPHLMRLLPRWNELIIKRVVEPVLVFAGGWMCLGLNMPLGSYLMVASAALMVSVTFCAEYERRRSLDLYDAYVDQRQISERFRRMRGDRF